MTPREQKLPSVEHGGAPAESELLYSKDFIEGLAMFTRGEPLKWGATPLDPYLPDIVDQQQDVHLRMNDLFLKPPFLVPDQVEDYMFICNQSRFNHRLHRNHEGFSHRKQKDLAATPKAFQEIQQRVLRGHASPAEIIAVGTQLGVPTYELASLTIPYGQRIEELEPMRNAVVEAIIYHGGRVFESPETKYKIRGASFLMEGLADHKSLLTTRTRTIGNLADGSDIYERSSFVYQLSDLEFKKIEELPFEKTWMNDVIKTPGLEDGIILAMNGNNFFKAIPISVTTFVVNEMLVQEQYENRDTYNKNQHYFSAEFIKKYGEPSNTNPAVDTDTHPLLKGWIDVVVDIE